MAETNISTTKLCTWCKNTLSLTEFNRDKNRNDGRFPHCKPCTKVRMRERYLTNRSTYAEKNKKNYIENKDAYKSRAKDWARKNPERRREVAKNYVLNNPDKRHQTVSRYTKENLAYYAAAYKARQQRKRQAMPLWANEQNIDAIYRQSAWVTRVTGVKHHVDHYYPLKSDIVCGLHNEFNLRIITAYDNLSKGNNFPEE